MTWTLVLMILVADYRAADTMTTVIGLPTQAACLQAAQQWEEKTRDRLTTGSGKSVATFCVQTRSWS